MQHKLFRLLLPATILLAAFVDPPRKRKLFLVGDSTMSDKVQKAFPETGWGTMFAKFVDTSNTVVYNRAQNGRSTKSFLADNLWAPILDSLSTGDLVLIQFGHNDEVPTKKQATTEAEFQQNLLRYVSEARARKAIPILITPAARRKFGPDGKLEDTHRVYAELVRKIAAKESVPLIELDGKSQALLQSMGPESSKLLFNHLKPGEHPNYPEGKIDDTHFSELGARRMAEIVYASLKELHPGDILDHFYKPIPKKN
ncbi:rhamnogalacturonan acetylesterase [Paraflavitalea pollutisoli]|uniref:rhamnogalacturonan acetylesterase n=1 Tax=Paraflavitalea pollutisoli TaxID=3034143 RepID=UPI0023ED1D66|nr:rhamnogalacturonan acetylesterase [Paraflavitalea sp. H1-2-19X]